MPTDDPNEGGIAALVLNLDRSPERLEKVQAHLFAAGIEADRVPGVDGAALTDEERTLYDEGEALRLTGRPLTDGEIGCYLGHLRALHRAVDGDSPFALVFEDDIGPCPALPVVSKAMTAIEGWEVANLATEGRRDITWIADVDAGGTVHRIGRAHYPPMNAWTLLWSRNGAARMLAEYGRVREPWDHAVRRFAQDRDSALCVSPLPVGRPDGASDIDAAGNRTRVRGGWRYRWRKQIRLRGQKRLARQARAKRREG